MVEILVKGRKNVEARRSIKNAWPFFYRNARWLFERW